MDPTRFTFMVSSGSRRATVHSYGSSPCSAFLRALDTVLALLASAGATSRASRDLIVEVAAELPCDPILCPWTMKLSAAVGKIPLAVTASA